MSAWFLCYPASVPAAARFSRGPGARATIKLAVFVRPCRQFGEPVLSPKVAAFDFVSGMLSHTQTDHDHPRTHASTRVSKLSQGTRSLLNSCLRVIPVASARSTRMVQTGSLPRGGRSHDRYVPCVTIMSAGRHPDQQSLWQELRSSELRALITHMPPLRS